MNRLIPWVLAAIVAIPAMAVAQDEKNATAAATETFALGAERHGPASYVLHAKSRVEQALTLGAEGLPDGYSATFAPAELKVGPDQPARSLLTVEPRPTAPLSFVAYATNGAGERHAVKVQMGADKPAPAAGSFGLKIEPEGARIEPNGTAKLVVHVRSAQEQTISLKAHLARGSGYRVEVEPASIEVGPDAPGKATLVVHAGPNATSAAAIEVVGSNGEERHGAVAKVGMLKPAVQKPRPAAAEPRETKITIETPGEEPIVIRVSGPGGLRALAKLLLELGGAKTDG